MAKVRSAVTLKDWILRQLGAPVIQVEVTEEQIYDCIDEAIELFTEFHYDGASKNILACRVTESMAQQNGVYLGDRVYAVNRVISGGCGSKCNRPMTQSMESGFVRIFSGGYGGGYARPSSIFSELNGFSMISMYIWQQYQSEFQKMMNPAVNFSFNSVTKELKLLDDIPEGSILAFEVYTPAGVKIESTRGAAGGDIYNDKHHDNPCQPQWTGGVVVDSNPYFDQAIYDNRWVKEFSRAMVKRVHGTIMKKYEGAKLPGGLTVNGDAIYREATDEMKELREELNNLDEPMPVFMG